MIQQISIKNFAIIDDLVIDFKRDINIFTGETGAGKSIIIEALGLLTGERANASMVRHGTSKAIIEGVFHLPQPLISQFNLHEYIDNQQLIIRKEIDSDGRSIIKINGVTSSLSLVKQITANIIDIHSQQDNQYLLNKSYHLMLLDNFGKQELAKVRTNYDSSYQQLQTLNLELERLKGLMVDDKRIEFMRFELEEIDSAKLKENELEALTLEQKRIQEYENLNARFQIINTAFSGDNNVLSQLYASKKAIDYLAKDPLFAKFGPAFEVSYIQLQELYQDLKNEFDKLGVDELRLNEIQQRIFEINKLKRKYGQTTSAILEYRNKLAQSINDLESVEYKILKIKQEIEIALDKVKINGNLLEQQRAKVFTRLTSEIKIQLKDLFLENAELGLINSPKSYPDKHGLIDYEFSASLNPGTPLKPLIKVASGGEMGRLMLGLKVIFNQHFNLDTSIFDEIDVGISGKVARAVGLKMLKLAEVMQVIVITHSPQVASLGKNHFLVEKTIKNQVTKTDVNLLTYEKRVVEIAKMLSGTSKPTDVAIANAKELLTISK
jgi:DNA repair protein RecN (Recombination protein N)